MENQEKNEGPTSILGENRKIGGKAINQRGKTKPNKTKQKKSPRVEKVSYQIKRDCTQWMKIN